MKKILALRKKECKTCQRESEKEKTETAGQCRSLLQFPVSFLRNSALSLLSVLFFLTPVQNSELHYIEYCCEFADFLIIFVMYDNTPISKLD